MNGFLNTARDMVEVYAWYFVGVALLMGFVLAAREYMDRHEPLVSRARAEYLHEDRGERSRAAVLARLESIPVPGSWDTGEGA